MDEGRRTRYLDCCAAGAAAAAPSAGSRGGEQGPAVAGDVLRQWPYAALQAAEGTRLPQVGAPLLAQLVCGCVGLRWVVWLTCGCQRRCTNLTCLTFVLSPLRLPRRSLPPLTWLPMA